MSIILAVLSLVLLRNRLAVEQKRPWLVKAQNSLRPSASRHSSHRSELPCGNILTYWDIGKHRSELYS